MINDAAPAQPGPHGGMSLRTFLRFVATLALAFGAAWVVAVEFRAAENALRQQTTLAAFQADRNLHLTLESARAYLDSVAESIDVADGGVRLDAAADRAIRRAMTHNIVVRGVIVLDANGIVVAAGAPQLGIGLDFGGYDFVRALRADPYAAYSFGIPFDSHILRTGLVPFARAVRDDAGALAGAVAIGLPLDALQAALATDAGLPGAQAFLIRKDGQLLAAVGDGSDIGQLLQDVWTLRKGQPSANYGTGDLAGARGRIVAWRENLDFPLTVAVAAPRDPFPPTTHLTVVVAVLAFGALAGLIWATAYLADREIRHVNAAMAELAAARDAARHAHAVAEHASHAKTLLLARFSHEFRTPLNAVIGFADLTRLGYGGAIPERARENLSIIHRAGDHLHRMIGTLLDLSRLELDPAALNKECSDLKQILRDAVDMATADAAAKSVEIELHMPTLPCRADCDRSRLLQVLVNLLSNAVRNGPHRSVVAATLQMDADGVGFRVQDQGPGIAPERLQTIFEPFGGAHPNIVRAEGTGLGLAISAQIMAAHGGSLTLENRHEGGLCATAILPGGAAKVA
jgi:signal transduction histidine kinase